MVIDERGLVEAIKHLVAEEEARSGLTIHLQCDEGIPQGSSQVEGAIYRIVQEALTNVKRHSETDYAAIRLYYENDVLGVEVRDLGIGFDLDQVSAERFGLRSIRERARLFGGEATISSQLEFGTTVRAEFPLLRTSGQIL